jgi:hypothetical protein
MPFTNAPIDWLLEAEPWIAYRTRLDLLDRVEGLGIPAEKDAVPLADPAGLTHHRPAGVRTALTRRVAA